MQTALSEEQRLLRESITELLDRECSFDRVREVEDGAGFDDQLWKQLGSLGWLGLPFPEDAGGGGTLTDLAIVIEQLARHAALVPYATVAAAGLTLARYASADIRTAFVPGVVSGERLIVPALLDAADSYDTLSAREAVAGQVSGSRQFVEYGQFANGYLIRVDRGETRVELVEAAPETICCVEERTTARTPAATIQFTGASSLPVAGPEAFDFLVNLGRALASVECLGHAARALEMTVDYVQHRVQFGRPIGSFQAVQHHIANMATLTEATRFLVFETLWAMDNKQPAAERAAVAKAFASRATVEVTALAHQLHGGIGVTEEYNLRFFSLRAKERSLAWGTPAECVDVVARSIDRRVEWA